MAPDQYDLSLTVYNDAAKFNLDRLDAVGVSGVRNVSIEGDIETTVSPTATAFFILPAGRAIPPRPASISPGQPGGVATRDYMPEQLGQRPGIQAVGFGSYTNSSGVVSAGIEVRPPRTPRNSWRRGLRSSRRARPMARTARRSASRSRI